MDTYIMSGEVSSRYCKTSSHMSFPWLDVPNDRTVCLNYSARKQLSLDFLACEGVAGWPATHTLISFATTLFLGNPLLVWLIAGIVEMGEALVLTLLGATWLGETNLQPETLAGSLIGDWALNDLIGILAAWTFLRLFHYTALLQPWYHTSFMRSQHEQQLRRELPRIGSRYWWKQHVLACLYLISGVFPAWIIPSQCPVFDQPYSCINSGLLLSIGWQLVGIGLFWYWWMRTADDKRYLWQPARMSRRHINHFFGLWALFVLAIGLNNAQSLIPLWFFPRFGEWAQVWLFAGAWFVLLLGMSTRNGRSSS